jgi:hypothetical protein
VNQTSQCPLYHLKDRTCTSIHDFFQRAQRMLVMRTDAANMSKMYDVEASRRQSGAHVARTMRAADARAHTTAGTTAPSSSQRYPGRRQRFSSAREPLAGCRHVGPSVEAGAAELDDSSGGCSALAMPVLQSASGRPSDAF